ncbi:hypothetical protein FBY31_2732 [Arthrobacter sp. SLBN-100]|uniref:hypothetical protein n=1 Tax=Arthrobacter sp. SLBN-100 TaxID=2768450 RepID=UPI00114FFAF7|nr:hypothetical protein [Arthrobacter sp. SLBN-100]TQJ68626.1 hypothetical protein FBY31_2732 [Arthrobacter sp. SLBN-100]
MFLRDLFASLRRRWYLVIAGVLLTAALAFVVYGRAPVRYEATGSVALVPPPTAVISGDNPFLYMGGLEQALGVLTVKLNSPDVQRGIVGKYDSVEYSTSRDPSTNGPIVLVTVTAAREEDALKALDDVLGAVPQNLNSLQDSLNVSEPSTVTSLPLSSDEEAGIDDSARTRMTLSFGAAGIAGTLLLTGQLDKVLLRRRAGKGTRRARAGSRNGKRPEGLGSVAAQVHKADEASEDQQHFPGTPTLGPEHERMHAQTR